MSQSIEEFLFNLRSLLAYMEYEKESQLYFRKGINKYTGSSDIEVEFRTFAEKVIGNSSALQNKIYSYQNAIISLYGYLERFIEDRIIEYLKNISDVCLEYKSLPSEIRKNHLGLSLDLVNKIQKIRGLSVAERKATLCSAVSIMNDFLSESTSFRINYDAFVNHSANFRYDTIHEVFTRIGIRDISKKCLKNDNFVTILSQKHGIEGSSSQKVLVSLLMGELDDLAQRRNEIAHGARIDDIQSINMTISRIKLIEAYVQAIDQVVTKGFEQYTFSVMPNLSLGTATKVFPRLNVLGFTNVNLLEPSNSGSKISEGDMLFAVNNNASEKIISGRIASLQVEGVQQKIIEIPCGKPASIGVDFNISEHFEKRSIFVVPHA